MIEEENKETAEAEVIPSMADFETEIEASFRTINEGDVIKGAVIDVTDEEVTLDLNYYAQGIIRVEDLSDDPTFNVLDDVKIGDVIEATVVSVDDGQGNILLSKKEANAVLAWDKLIALKDAKTTVTAKITEVNKAGAIAYVEGIRGFIPASQLALSYVEDTTEFLHKTLNFRVTEVNKEKEKLILSAKDILMEESKAAHDHKVAKIIPGTITEGTVESLQTYGAFIDLGDGLTGLCHISQISDKRIKKPSEVLEVGQKVKVKILNTNEGKIALSIKEAALAAPDEDIESPEAAEYSSHESIGTGLSDLLKNLKF